MSWQRREPALEELAAIFLLRIRQLDSVIDSLKGSGLDQHVVSHELDRAIGFGGEAQVTKGREPSNRGEVGLCYAEIRLKCGPGISLHGAGTIVFREDRGEALLNEGLPDQVDVGEFCVHY